MKKLILLILALLCYTSLSYAQNNPEKMLITGAPLPSLSGFESDLITAMEDYNVPGGAVAIMKDGKLLYSRGFGYANRKTRTPVQPNSLFRLASISKVLTAIAVMQLVEKKHINLDDKAFSILKNTKPFPGAQVDPRLYQITVRQLLDMSSGMGPSPNHKKGLEKVAQAAQESIPPSRGAFLRYMMGMSLAFDPGTDYKYSNAGYNVLAYIVEDVSGQSFETYISEHILKPLAMTETKLGHTLWRDRDPREVHYYMPPGSKKRPSIFPEIKQTLPCPYGGCYYLESQFGSGAWISSAPEMVKVFSHLPRLLSPQTLAMMGEKPKHYNEEKTSWHGIGWSYTPLPTGIRMSKHGGLDGVSTWIFRNPEGVVIAGFFNTRAQDKETFNKTFSQLLLRAGHEVEKESR